MRRLIAADRDLVVTDLLDTIAGEAEGKPVVQLQEFQHVLKKSSQAILEPVKSGGVRLQSSGLPDHFKWHEFGIVRC